MPITISAEAGEQLRQVMDQNTEHGSGLRLWVASSCGCGNVGYGMGLDEACDGDTVYQAEGVTVIIDPGSASLLGGAMVDFVDNGRYGSGFVIHTKDQSGGGCGCGAH
ncbi:MAG: iron-sulfur cluster assembly accessory protein [Thermomicrobiales bacterium]